MAAEHNSILAEKAFRLTAGAGKWRRFASRWLPVAAAVPLLGVVAAFGIAPNTSTETVMLQRVIEDVPLTFHQPDTEDVAQYWREERIQRGDTIGALLARLQIDDPEAANYLRTARNMRSLYQLVPGRTVRAVTTDRGAMVSLRYLNGDGTELLVQRRGGDFFAREQALTTESRLLMTSGEIETSLFAATDAAGLSDSVAIQLTEIFSSEVDFHRDLRAGDRFAIVFEGFFNNGELVRTAGKNGLSSRRTGNSSACV